jgi:hypothetical protein
MEDVDNAGTVSMARTLQIITVALAGGLVAFAVVGIFMRQSGAMQPNGATMISAIMAILTAVLIAARVLVPRLIVRGGLRRIARSESPSSRGRSGPGSAASDDREQLQGLFSAKTIASGAILEGAGFANLVAYLLEGQAYSLALAAILVLGILAATPTRGALEDWLDQACRRVVEIRDMPGWR